MKMTITFNSRAFEAAAIIASKDPARFTLNSVLLEKRKDKNLWIGTDGKRLVAINSQSNLEVVWQSEPKEEFDLLLPLPDLRRLKLAKGSKKLPCPVNLRVEVDETSIVYHSGNFSQRIEIKSEVVRYPKWRNVLPNGEHRSMTHSSFNPTLLRGFQDVGAKLTGMMASKITIVASVFSDNTGVARVFLGVPEMVYGLIMPINTTGNYFKPTESWICQTTTSSSSTQACPTSSSSAEQNPSTEPNKQ